MPMLASDGNHAGPLDTPSLYAFFLFQPERPAMAVQSTTVRCNDRFQAASFSS
jgi:hypothetical protein